MTTAITTITPTITQAHIELLDIVAMYEAATTVARDVANESGLSFEYELRRDEDGVAYVAAGVIEFVKGGPRVDVLVDDAFGVSVEQNGMGMPLPTEDGQDGWAVLQHVLSNLDVYSFAAGFATELFNRQSRFSTLPAL